MEVGFFYSREVVIIMNNKGSANFIRILILDENHEIHQDLQKFFYTQNLLSTFKVDIAEQGKEAIDLIKRSVQEKNTYAIAFLDLQQTSNLDCVKIIKEIWHVDSRIQVVICAAQSGYLWEKLASAFGIIDNLIVIQKPFEVSLFKQVVCALVKKWEASITESLQQKIIKAQSELTLNGLVQLEVENQLRRAIEKKQFSVYYQPQIDLLTGQCRSVEALVRWNHPEKGLLLPDQFILIAEESGLIVPLGEWILETACRQNYLWQQAGFKPVRVAVNISRQQFETEQLIPSVKRILADTKLPPHLLELELSENMIINNQKTIDKIYELKNLGVAIALDDFGTGFSSLGYLKKIPLDRIKIDKSFIKNINVSSDDEAFIRAIIAIAKSLNLQVTAEGVESEVQTQFLVDNQCYEVQGFLFGKGLEATYLSAYLNKFDSL